ncbi:MAG: iron-containing alcohol dehydrogenase [Paludibaculum sp.]
MLITYGGGSIHKNGVYAQVMQALEGRTVLEFGGIEPNPEYDTLMGAVELVRREKVDLLLAVGGGIGAGRHEVHCGGGAVCRRALEHLTKGAAVESPPCRSASVLTLPATGSESNTFAVISRRSTGQKLAFGSVHCYPKFAVLDPETTFSLPARQVANGIVDAFVHTLRAVQTFPVHAELNDPVCGVDSTDLDQKSDRGRWRSRRTTICGLRSCGRRRWL